MELQFEKTPWECLSPVVTQVRQEEQAQEVRLTDAMPDIGRVLAAWGQVLLRGKEWRSGGMTVSGGVMAWVLYDAEDGSGPQNVETWIPFQLRWEFPETKHDGMMLASCQLSGVDARSVSARKLMVRANVSIMGQALVPEQVEVYRPGTVPEDVQLLRRSYPVRIPREAGEKQFLLDEELALPGSAGQVQKLIRYCVQPEVIDQKVMAGRVVFRGMALVHILYQDQENALKTWDFEVPFSQYADLEREYDQDAEVRLVPAVTNLELDPLEDGRLHLKAGLVGQFVVTDRPMLEVVEDAYSTRRAVTPQFRELLLPVQLDGRRETIRMEADEELDAERIVDTAFLTGQPRVQREDDGVELEQAGTFQMLYYDREGSMKGGTVRAEADTSISADGSTRVNATAAPTGREQASLNGGKVSVRADVLMDAVSTWDQGIPMITGLELGEMTQPDPNRPSLILRRAGEAGLWDIAKGSGSTVEAIRLANHLQGEPEEDRMLLIPVS